MSVTIGAKIGMKMRRIEIHSRKKPAIKIIAKKENKSIQGVKSKELTKFFIIDIPPDAAKTPVNKLPAIKMNIIIEVTVIVLIKASLKVWIVNFL